MYISNLDSCDAYTLTDCVDSFSARWRLFILRSMFFSCTKIARMTMILCAGFYPACASLMNIHQTVDHIAPVKSISCNVKGHSPKLWHQAAVTKTKQMSVSYTLLDSFIFFKHMEGEREWVKVRVGYTLLSYMRKDQSWERSEQAPILWSHVCMLIKELKKNPWQQKILIIPYAYLNRVIFFFFMCVCGEREIPRIKGLLYCPRWEIGWWHYFSAAL